MSDTIRRLDAGRGRSPEEDAAYYGSIWQLSTPRVQELERAFRAQRAAGKLEAGTVLTTPRLDGVRAAIRKIGLAEVHANEVAARLPELDRKEVYNALTYLASKGELKRVGYGKYLINALAPSTTISSLKSCPFCSGTLLGRQEGERRTDGTAGEPAKIICADCDARIFAYSLDQAIVKWNRRALVAALTIPARSALEPTAAPVVQATLRRAGPMYPGPIVGNHINGDIYGDTKQRFSDGTNVTTSKVVSIDGDILKTHNSVYRVEWHHEAAIRDRLATTKRSIP